MADRSISISLEARVQGFVTGMRTAQQAASDFGGRLEGFAQRNEQSLDRVGKASLVMGGGLLAGALMAVKSFMEFDSAMSEVQASTHETEANMDRLREAAINAGADTAFSAKEAAQGIDELAKAGVSTADVLNGGLTGALSLAAAGSLGVGDAAEIAATALTQFKLSGKDIPHVADLLAAGAGKAQGSVEDIGNALKQSGLVASQFGLSIEDTTGTLASFASAGLVGSDAGTSLKTMLLKLASPSKEAAGMMSELGIAAYDATGKFVGVKDLAGQLKDKLGGLTQAQRDSTLATIFGTDAIRGANVLYEQGAEGISGWIDKVNDAGFAAVTASIKQDNLAGDLEKLGGSFDSVLIKGGGGAAEALRGLVQGLEGVVDSIGKIPPGMLQFGVGAAGMVGAALLVAGGFMTVLPKIAEFRVAMAALSAPSGMPRTASAIGSVGKSATGAVIGLLALQAAAAIFTEKNTKSAEEYGQALLKVGKAGNAAKSSDLDSLFQGLSKAFGQDISKVNNMADAVERLSHQTFDDSGNKFFEGFTNFLGLPKGEIGQIEDSLKGLGSEMGNLAKNGASETAAKSFNLLTKEFEKNGQGAKEALEHLPAYKDALLGLANQAGVTDLTDQELLDWAGGKLPDAMAKATAATETYTTKVGNAAPMTEGMAKALEEVGLAADGSIVSIDNFAKSLFAAGLLSLSASDAAIGYQDAIDKMTESVTKNGTTLDINTEAGRANQSAFNGLAQAAMTSAEASATETLASQGSAAAQAQLQGALRTSYGDLVNAANQLGITGDEADTMARKALGIPKNVNIDAWIADHASSTLDGIKGKAEGLDGKKVTVSIYTNEYMNKLEQRTILPDLNGDASGSGRPGVATGGRISGPGTGTSDTAGLFRLSDGEFVVRESAARAIGYDNLNRLNGGDTQLLKPMGYAYSPAPAPSAPAAMGGFSAPAAMGDIYVQNPFTGEYLLAQVDGRVGAGLSSVSRQVGGMRK